MKEENITLAMLIAKKAGMRGTATTSTASLAANTGFSQQSISRKLRELEAEGLITRRASNTGIEVSLTGKGRHELESLYSELRELFAGREKASLSGSVTDGLGEGTYYTMLPGYREQFRGIFGTDIFPGTLNLKVEPAQRDAFTSPAPIQVKGFRTPERTFGGIDCWPCKVGGKIRAAAILPHRTNHPVNVIEVISPAGLRKKLGLANGSQVRLERE